MMAGAVPLLCNGLAGGPQAHVDRHLNAGQQSRLAVAASICQGDRLEGRVSGLAVTYAVRLQSLAEWWVRLNQASHTEIRIVRNGRYAGFQ